jgi:tRNA-Thr(GGU) m(6)t(6)A37 methyltransferase TsaA
VSGEIRLRPIGVARTPFATTAEVPRGLGTQHTAEGRIEILPELESGLRDIEGFSHLFVLWVFDRSEGYELIGTNPTDGLEHGVFATRSPRRPNPLALSVVELLGRDGCVLRVRGVDMLDGSPVLDLKPYLSGVPLERLRRGWLAEAERRTPQRDDPRD